MVTSALRLLPRAFARAALVLVVACSASRTPSTTGASGRDGGATTVDAGDAGRAIVCDGTDPTWAPVPQTPADCLIERALCPEALEPLSWLPCDETASLASIAGPGCRGLGALAGVSRRLALEVESSPIAGAHLVERRLDAGDLSGGYTVAIHPLAGPPTAAWRVPGPFDEHCWVGPVATRGDQAAAVVRLPPGGVRQALVFWGPAAEVTRLERPTIVFHPEDVPPERHQSLDFDATRLAFELQLDLSIAVYDRDGWLADRGGSWDPDLPHAAHSPRFVGPDLYWRIAPSEGPRVAYAPASGTGLARALPTDERPETEVPRYAAGRRAWVSSDDDLDAELWSADVAAPGAARRERHVPAPGSPDRFGAWFLAAYDGRVAVLVAHRLGTRHGVRIRLDDLTGGETRFFVIPEDSPLDTTPRGVTVTAGRELLVALSHGGLGVYTVVRVPWEDLLRELPSDR